MGIFIINEVRNITPHPLLLTPPPLDSTSNYINSIWKAERNSLKDFGFWKHPSYQFWVLHLCCSCFDSTSILMEGEYQPPTPIYTSQIYRKQLFFDMLEAWGVSERVLSVGKHLKFYICSNWNQKEDVPFWRVETFEIWRGVVYGCLIKKAW